MMGLLRNGLIMGVVLGSAAAALAAEESWPSLMARQDFIVSKDTFQGNKPGFFSGVFLGDGTAGGMIFREEKEPNTLRWQMGRYDVLATEGIPGLEYCNPRLFAGEILLTPAGTPAEQGMRLSIWDAMATGQITTDKGQIQWRAYVHRTQHAYVMVVQGTGGEADPQLRVHEQWGVSPNYLSESQKPNFDKAKFAQFLPPQPEMTQKDGITLITQRLRNPAAHAVAWTVVKADANTRILLATIGKGYGPSKPIEASVQAAQDEALSRLNAVRAIPLAELDRTHTDWWHQHLQRSRLELPDDPKWEQFWWRQIYKFASASAEDSAYVIDNEGPWIYYCSWGAIWWNLNVQLSYYPTFSANRLDVGKSLINAVDRFYKSGALNDNAGKWSADSVFVGRSTDNITGRNGWGDESANLTWVLHNCWRYWRHSGDDQVGRWLFPVLKQNVNWYLHNLQEGPDGKLHMPPTRSPEYEDVRQSRGLNGYVKDANYAISSLHWALKTLLEMDTQFGMIDPMRSTWIYTKSKLIDPPTDKDGLMIGSDQPYDESHRHYSHLLAIYPYHLINPDQGPEARDLIQRSVDKWQSMPRYFAGYSFTGGAAMYAVLGDGDKAIKTLDQLLKRVYPNTIYTEGSNMVIETPLSAVDSVNYMLLQSWGGKIRIFPAVPSRWQNVRFADFSAEGAFLASAERKNSQTTFVKVLSQKGGQVHLVSSIPTDAMKITAPPDANVKVVDGIVTASLKAGEVLVVTNKTVPAN